MLYSKVLKAAIVATSMLAATSASAAVVTLDFEGIGNFSPVGNFYNGGAGTNYGIQFSPTTLALVDSDAGGNGNIANEPSSNTVMFFLDASNAILDVAAGFDTGFSFFYSSSTTASVNVYDGLGATGNLLASLVLAAQFSENCSGDPNGAFCNFSPIGVLFGGIAKSIDFGGTANQIAFDNITLGSAAPGISPVPLPAAAWLFGSALLGFAGFKRRTV